MRNTYREINKITEDLIRFGLSKSQNFPCVISNSIITWSGQTDISFSLKDIDYNIIYKAIDDGNNYNIKMLDGALIQMMYTFNRDNLVSHRLAFFPSPRLEKYEDNPTAYEELYFDEAIYHDMISKNIVPFPIRLDYNNCEEMHVDIKHPRTHLHLGQYENCRIPVKSPITPYAYMHFILRNFYSAAFEKYFFDYDFSSETNFEDSITCNEKKILYLGVER